MSRLIALFIVLVANGASAESRSIPAWVKEGKPKDQPTRLIEDLPGFRPQVEVALDRFGGSLATSLKATGFFRVEKFRDRWWMVTPEGHPCFNIAATSVNVSKSSPTLSTAFKAKFKDTADWRDQTIALLRDHGFTGTGAFSNDEVLIAAPNRLPYTLNANFMSGYGKRRGGTKMGTGHVSYPNDCIFAFDPAFETFCDEHAATLARRKDDPFLVGYFSDNEMPFRLDALDLFLKNDPADAGRAAAEQLMAKRHGATWDAKDVTEEDRQAFMELLADRYFGVVVRAMRKHDPNHLYLGSRFYGTDHRNPALLRAAGRHVDVISYNLYGVWSPNAERIGPWERLSGRPILITEFYAKGEDSGMNNKSGAGWTVATQAQRGAFYQNFALSLIESKVCVGWHWLRYVDNASDDSAADASNRDSNKGLLNGRLEPYEPLLERMKDLNRQAQALAAYFDGQPD